MYHFFLEFRFLFYCWTRLDLCQRLCNGKDKKRNWISRLLMQFWRILPKINHNQSFASETKRLFTGLIIEKGDFVFRFSRLLWGISDIFSLCYLLHIIDEVHVVYQLNTDYWLFLAISFIIICLYTLTFN